MVARYGAEAFAVILSDTDVGGAEPVPDGSVKPFLPAS